MRSDNSKSDIHIDSKQQLEPSKARGIDRRYLLRYILLSAAIFLPLLWAFVKVKNVYPFAAATMMMSGGNFEKEHTYYVLLGETVGGEIIDVGPSRQIDALDKQLFGLFIATVRNDGFRLKHPHPDNAAWLTNAGNAKNLPRAARLPELLRAWGRVYNDRLPPESPRRLKAIRLDEYKWEGKRYADYDRFVESWREEF